MAPLDGDGTFVDEDAWVNGVLEYVVAAEVTPASGGHALVDDHTSDADDDDGVAVATNHPFRPDQNDAYDAALAATFVVVVALNLDHDGIRAQASFHWGDRHHCCHCSAEILYFLRADQRLTAVDLFDHRSAI